MTGPLSSLKILDFSTLLPGPFASMMLADLGANVLHVEAPHRPDMFRSISPLDGDTSAWHALLRGPIFKGDELSLRHGNDNENYVLPSPRR